VIGKWSLLLGKLIEGMGLLHGHPDLLDLLGLLVAVILQVLLVEFELSGGDCSYEDFSHFWKYYINFHFLFHQWRIDNNTLLNPPSANDKDLMTE
jgi:hypothetical protein